MLYLIIIIPVLLSIILAFYYNRLVKFKNKVNDAWSGINIQLKKRYNLIPSLVEIVKSYAEYEQQIFEDLVSSRETAINAESVNEQTLAENQISNSISKLISLTEDTPKLKANTNYIQLQETLHKTEKQIEMARRYYNAVVRDNNTFVESFPAILLYKSFGFSMYEYFKTDNPSYREPIKIEM